MCIEPRRHSEQNPWTYPQLEKRQLEIAADIRNGSSRGAFLLSEVAPVITLGRRANSGEILVSPEVLRSNGIQVHSTDRGGLATYHGPGQWVLFVVGQLEQLTGDSRGVRKVVGSLLGLAHAVALRHRVPAEIRWGCETGVWTERGKLASVGLCISDGIVLHGLSFNGFRTPQSFFGLRPCGLERPVDFVLQEPSDAEFVQLGQDLLIEATNTFSSENPPFRIDPTPN